MEIGLILRARLVDIVNEDDMTTTTMKMSKEIGGLLYPAFSALNNGNS